MFRKVAKVRSLGSLEYDGKRLARIARSGGDVPARHVAQSYFLDGARKLPIGDLLARVAEQYFVSDNPHDYLFEAIRANTTNVPNENNDGFHQAELLRFDTRLGMPVYMTYAGKPHHVDHKTENPKAARGVIIDAHYHDRTPPLENCPRCRLHTAARNNRDETGIHCKRCGYAVRDEFVEILVGVDAKKDPDFARGVRTGQLDAGSMGCNCLNTICNVCRHVAYSRPEFCEHIRSAKGSLWKKQGNVWVRTSPMEIQREASKRKYAWDPTDFCYLTTDDGYEVRRAFEYCQNVIFDEYSRVGQPADPKARQREVLKTASVIVPAALHTPGYMPTTDDLRAETAQLIQATQMHRSAQMMPMMPTKFMVVRLNGDAADTHAAPTIEEALEVAGVGPEDQVSVRFCEVEAEDAISAIEQFDESRAQDWNGKEGDIVLQAPPNEPVVIQPSEQSPQPGGPPAPGAPGPSNIEDYQDQLAPGPGPKPPQQLSPAEMGVMPPGANAPRDAQRRQPMKFKNAYRGWTVEVSPEGNARIITAKKESILVIRGQPESDPKKRHTWGLQLLAHMLEHGFVATAEKYKGIFTPKIAQVVDGAIDDMKEFADKYTHDSVREDAIDDMKPEREKPPSKVPDDDVDDMQDARGKPPSSTQDDGVVDHAEGKPEGVDSATQEDNTDMADERGKGPKRTTDDEIHDHSEKLAALTRVGGKIAHQKAPQVEWTVRIASLKESGEYEVSIVAAGQQPRRVGQKDLLTYWKALDKKPAAPAPLPKVTADTLHKLRAAGIKADVENGQLVVGDVPKAAELGANEKKRMAAFEQRLKKAFAAREEKLKKEAADELDLVRRATVESFCRALRIVAHRQAADIEASPLKQAAIAAFSTPRQLGADNYGNVVEFQGMDPELVRYLVAEVYATGHGQHLETLMGRAAELMLKGDQYLVDAETDLQHLRPALPPITASAVQPLDPVQQHALAMRQAAVNGNFNINAGPPADPGMGPGFDKRSQIRGAVQGTMVQNTLGTLRALNQPN